MVSSLIPEFDKTAIWFDFKTSQGRIFGGQGARCRILGRAETPEKREAPLPESYSDSLPATFGDPITSCRLIETDNKSTPAPKPLTGIPKNSKTVPLQSLREEFYSRKAGEPDAQQKAFSRSLNDLQSSGHIGHRDSHIWVINNDRT